jgi:ABC-type amino acid transport substrate-binding protein
MRVNRGGPAAEEAAFRTTKETIVKLPSLLLSLACAALPALTTGVHAQTLQKIRDNNAITVGYREASVPFSYLISPTKSVGLSVDLTEAVVDEVRKTLRKPDLAVVWVPVTGQNRIPLLASGGYDLECGSTTNTAARGKDVAFSVSYFYAGTRLLTRKDSGVRDYGDLAGKVVATTAGSTNEKVLLKYAADHNLQMKTVQGKDYREAFELLESGRAAALALDDVLLFGLRANAKTPENFEVVGETLQVEPYGCMVRKDDPEFKAVVDRAITNMMKTGEFSRKYARWFQSPIPPAGANLDMPMSAPLKANLRNRDDKPAF